MTIISKASNPTLSVLTSNMKGELSMVKEKEIELQAMLYYFNIKIENIESMEVYNLLIECYKNAFFKPTRT